MKNPNDGYPRSLSAFIDKYPMVWKAYSDLGEGCNRSGPLDKKVLSLLKMVTAAVLKMETPFKTHSRKAVQAGASREEIEHALLTLMTSSGIATTMMGFKWISEMFDDNKNAS